ncbi:unnamed protein product [Phytophthora fragariaefolia]|uniref:Unnamed protein product n=1 Tax=Phytophthora fragariaefolia TaxID=1490495 RepID=A0A9W7D570_9STRA|nr:unnamed protein product [Phytophthora fragariaefolia]
MSRSPSTTATSPNVQPTFGDRDGWEGALIAATLAPAGPRFAPEPHTGHAYKGSRTSSPHTIEPACSKSVRLGQVTPPAVAHPEPPWSLSMVPPPYLVIAPNNALPATITLPLVNARASAQLMYLVSTRPYPATNLD